MEFELKVWRLHPQGVRIVPAEKTLDGLANPDGVKWCGPYTNANKYGFWLYPPTDLDFVWRDDGKFEYGSTNWENTEVPFIRSLLKDTDTPNVRDAVENFGGRIKVDFGRVEPNICQIWSGCAFQTPPGWCLLIRSPINTNMDSPYRIQEGILETDWLPYDIWINVAVQVKDTRISLRRDQKLPLAQLVPVQRDAYNDQWRISEEPMNRDGPRADKAYTDWADYNYKKYVKRSHEMAKDSGTYFKERARQLRPRKVRLPKATPKRFIKSKKDEK